MGQFDDERAVELKAQINSAFAERAGKPGYGADGWKTPGLANQATRDEGRRMEQNQKQIMRVAQQNAKKALRAGDMAGWQQWSQAAGGKTFGIADSQQSAQTGGLAADRQAQNAYRLNGGVTATGEPSAAAASNAGQSATDSAATPPAGSGAARNTIPERRDGEGSFAYAERLAQFRGKQEGVWGGDANGVVSVLRDTFAKQDAARAAANPLKPDDDWKSGLTGFYPETKEQPKQTEKTKGPLTEWFEQKAEKAKEAAPIHDSSLFTGDWTPQEQKDIQFVGSNSWQKEKSAATPESEAKYAALKNEVESDYEVASRLVDTAEPFIIMAQSPRIQKFAKEIIARKTARSYEAEAMAKAPQ